MGTGRPLYKPRIHLICLLATVPYALVLAQLFPQLQPSLDVLCGIGDADLDAPCDPTRFNPASVLNLG